MSIINNTYETADVTHIKEQVLDKIYMFEREETPIFSGAKKRKAESLTPEWLNDTLRSAQTNALIEGDEFAASSRTAPTRSKNHMQIMSETISVTGSNQAVKKYGDYQNELSYQMEKAVREVKRDAELAITQNQASVERVSDSTAGKLGGIESWVETNVSRGANGSNGGYNSGTGVTTAATDGTQRVFTEALLLDVMKTGYDNGARFSQIHLGSYNKQRLSSFSGNATRMSQDKKAISNTITVIENDFGKLTAMINPQQRTRTAILYDMSNIAVMNLRPFEKHKLAKTNDSMEQALVTEFTTKVVEKGLGVVADLTTSD